MCHSVAELLLLDDLSGLYGGSETHCGVKGFGARVVEKDPDLGTCGIRILIKTLKVHHVLLHIPTCLTWSSTAVAFVFWLRCFRRSFCQGHLRQGDKCSSSHRNANVLQYWRSTCQAQPDCFGKSLPLDLRGWRALAHPSPLPLTPPCSMVGVASWG